MKLTKNLEGIKERVIIKYDIGEDDAQDALEFSISEYKRLSNNYETSLEDYSDDVLIWIKKACFEIIERKLNGIIGGLKSYSENGYSWSTDGNIVSEQLQKEIIANADYPR